MPVAALQATRAEQLAKFDELESHERELLHDNQRREHKTDRTEKKCREAQDAESTKALTDTKVDLANAKEALCVQEDRASMDRSSLRTEIEERDCAQHGVEAMSARLQVA